MTEEIALTDPQHQVFVDRYFELGFNQTQAAIAAGYSKKSARNQAYRLMKNDDIRAEIQRRLAEQAMTANEVLARLADHGRGDMREFIGLSSKSLKVHPAGNLIKKYKRTFTTTLRENGETVKEERVEIELYDAQSALVQIGRYHNLFVDRLKVEDWHMEAIADIRAGRVQFTDLVEAFDDFDLATRLFKEAGVPIAAGEGETADGA